MLEELGLLTALDRGALAAYCDAYSIMVRAEATIAGEGVSVAGHRGVQRKHPLMSVLAQARAELRAWASEFGMTPTARSRMDLPPPEDDDESLLD